MELNALVAPLRGDVVSGASDIGRAAAEVVQQATLDIPCENAIAFRKMLVALNIQILEAQPAMAPLVTLASRVLDSFREEDPLDGAVAGVMAATHSFLNGLDQAAAQVAAHAGPLIPAGATILTLSSSSTVRIALELQGRERSIRVVCLESRPMSEGAHLAHSLSEAGLQVVYAIDAAAGSLIRHAELILLGGDSLGDRGVVNKVGSLALASLARDRGIPVHILLARSKFLPQGFPQIVDDDRPGDEVLSGATGIEVWNRYFEVMPLDSVASIVTEDGPASPVETEEFRSRIRVPPELRAWAKARASD